MSFLSQPVETQFIQPKRMIGTIAVQTIINEQATDTLVITKQPVQQGAPVTDHAYLDPVTFNHTILFAAPGITGGVSLNQIYTQLQNLQATREPFTIVTPKRIYSNMLMTSLGQTTDKQTENCLAIHASYSQVILVPVSPTTAIPRNHQKNAASTGATQNAGKKSILFQSEETVKGAFRGGG
jgi:hypothetical protein